jgi:hypothetical protein
MPARSDITSGAPSTGQRMSPVLSDIAQASRRGTEAGSGRQVAIIVKPSIGCTNRAASHLSRMVPGGTANSIERTRCGPTWRLIAVRGARSRREEMRSRRQTFKMLQMKIDRVVPDPGDRPAPRCPRPRHPRGGLEAECRRLAFCRACPRSWRPASLAPLRTISGLRVPGGVWRHGRPAWLTSRTAQALFVFGRAGAAGVASSLSMRRPSRSTTSKTHPSASKVSPALGISPTRCSARPASVA